jgi:hypothetical protein
MALRFCDCCGKRTQTSRVNVGAKDQQWFVCADCYKDVIPRIPKTSEVPLLSVLLGFLNPPPWKRKS